jgi:hypothetical protein
VGGELLVTTYPYCNALFISGVGVNGASVSAYDVSRFSTQPSINTPVPGGSADAGPVTTGDSFGYDGAFTIDLPTTDEYYIAVSNDGQIYWIGPVVGAGAGGSGASGGGNGEVLNSLSYGPSTPAGYDLTTTLAAIDTSHLTISFTVPGDGSVTIEADVPVGIGLDGSESVDVVLAFFEHGTTTLASAREIEEAAGQTDTSDFLISGRVTYKATVTGLTANADLQWDLAGLSSIAGATLAADDGKTGTNDNGPIIITVYGPQALSSDYLSTSGGTVDGTVYIETSGDTNPRITLTEAGLLAISSPAAPVDWGTHVSGDVGTGTDFGVYFEQLSDTARAFIFSAPRVRLTDGTNYLHLSAAAYTGSTLNTTQDVAVDVGSMSALASSGSLTVTSVLYGNGTLSYTGKTGTGATGTLTGCTATGISYDYTDTSDRTLIMGTDPFGNPTFFIGGGVSLGGASGAPFFNNQISFLYTALGEVSDEYDIYITFLDYETRDTGSAIWMGADGNVLLYRTADGSGNPEFLISADSNIYTYSISGLWPNSTLTLGQSAHPWGVAYLSGLNTTIVAKSSAYTMGALDDTVVVTGTTTITLPSAVDIGGRLYTIVNVGANVVTVATTSSQDINGATTYLLTTQYSAVTVQSNGTQWYTTGGSGSGGGGSSDVVTANLQTASYTPVAGDLGKVIEMDSSSPTTVTLTPGVFSAGDTFEVCQVGAGPVSFAAASGVPDISEVAYTNIYGDGQSTIALTPAAVGHGQVLFTRINSGSLTVSSISGGGGSWERVASPVVGADTAVTVEMWISTVATAGSSTATITWSGTVGSDFVDLNCFEFNSGLGVDTTWGVDVDGTVNTTSTSESITFPSLTATGSNELYIGSIFNTEDVQVGSTSGYTYEGEGVQDCQVFNPDVSGTQAPTATTTTAGYYSGIAACLVASGPGFTIDSYESYLELLGQWASASVRYRSASEAVVTGALTS